jgi:hypothetical protein
MSARKWTPPVDTEMMASLCTEVIEWLEDDELFEDLQPVEELDAHRAMKMAILAAGQLDDARQRGILAPWTGDTMMGCGGTMVEVGDGVVRHNAYVLGWEHGAANHNPNIRRVIHDVALRGHYYAGRKDGELARERAFRHAELLKRD